MPDKTFKSQAQNVYGEAEGRLNVEVNLKIHENEQKVQLKFKTDTQKWEGLEQGYTVKAYFWYRLRQVEKDYGTVGTLSDKKDDWIDLANLGINWKNAKWQLVISGPSSAGFGKFIHAWTDEQFVTQRDGMFTLDGEAIFELQLDELDTGLTWEVKIGDRNLPVLVVSQDLERLHNDIERQTLPGMLVIPEALTQVVSLLIQEFIEGTDVQDQTSWHGKWVKIIKEKLGVDFPLTEVQDEYSQDDIQKLNTYRKRTRIEFMKLLTAHSEIKKAYAEEGDE